MTGAVVCEQCKKACNLCKKPRSRSPRSTSSCGSARGSGSSSRSSCPPLRPKRKPIYVAADPSEQTCIVLGPREPGSSSGCDANGGGGGISLRFSGDTRKLRVSMPDLSKANGGQSSGSEDPNCIEIKGNSIVKTENGLQIMPCKAKNGGGGGSGGVQISLARSGGSGAECGGNIELSFGKGNSGQPSITCEPGSPNLEITYGPDKRKLNLNHSKPTVASMIHKRLTELEIEKKLAADQARGDIHERRC